MLDRVVALALVACVLVAGCSQTPGTDTVPSDGGSGGSQTQSGSGSASASSSGSGSQSASASSSGSGSASGSSSSSGSGSASGSGSSSATGTAAPANADKTAPALTLLGVDPPLSGVGFVLSYTTSDASPQTHWLEYGPTGVGKTPCPKGSKDSPNVLECRKTANQTQHGSFAVEVKGLQAGRDYRYWLVAVDEAGNRAVITDILQARAGGAPSPTTSASSTSTSNAPDTTPPAIVNVQTSGITASTATLTFSVSDTQSGVATTAVQYGLTSSLGSTQAASAGAGAKSVALAALSPGSTYHFRVVVTDQAGNVGYSPSSTGTHQFTTAAPPASVAISGVNVPSATLLHDTFTIAWTVTGPAGTTNAVDYGTSTAYGNTVAASNGPGSKTAAITGLVPDTTYFFRVRATDGSTSDEDLGQAATAAFHVVNILGNNGANSFSPANLAVVANEPFVVRVDNLDTINHDWHIDGQSYGTNTLAPSSAETISSSVTLAPGSYQMRCSIHSPMTGTVTAS